ncbi:iron-containing redox enzyme family protein, partial [Pseudomonas palleroniana]
MRQCYEQLFQGPDDADKQAVAQAFLQECIAKAAALPQEMPDDPTALQAWVEQHSAGVARQYADYLERR